jgi:hypothetical protein
MFVTLYGKTLETTLPDHYHRSACDNDLHGSSIAIARIDSQLFGEPAPKQSESDSAIWHQAEGKKL